MAVSGNIALGAVAGFRDGRTGPSGSGRRGARPQVRLSLETIIAIGDNQSLRMAQPIKGSESNL